MAGRSLNISLVATLTPLEKSLVAVGKMMTDFAQSIASTDAKLADSIRSSVDTMNTELAKVKQSFDNVGKNGDDAGKKAGGSLRTQLSQATIDAQKASEEFGRMSPQFIAAAQKAAMLKDEMGDVGQAIDALNPDAKFKAVSGVLQGVAGGFMAVEGGMAAFGVKSEEATKVMAKLQGLMAMSQGLNQLGALKDSMGAMKTQIMAAVGSMGVMKVALIATGIGAAAVVIGYLVTHWKEFKEAVLNLIPGLGKVATYIGDLVNKVTDFFGVTSDGSRKLAKAVEQADVSLTKNKKFLQQHGDQVDEFTKKKIEAVNTYNEAVKQEGTSDKDLAALKASLSRQLIAIDKERAAAGDAIAKKNLEATQKKQKELLDEKNKQAEVVAKAFQDRMKAQDEYSKQEIELIKQTGMTSTQIDKEFESIRLANKYLSDSEILQIISKRYEGEKKLREDNLKDEADALLKSQQLVKDSVNMAISNQKAELELYKKFKMGKADIDIKFEQIRKERPELSDAEVYTAIADRYVEDTSRMVNAGLALQQSLSNLAVNGIVLLATTIGELMAGGGSLESFFNSLVLMVADAAVQLGKQFIQMGIAALAIQTQLFINPPAAIAAGAALIAIGSMAKSSMANMGKQKKMAAGGIAYSPTNALVGEYSGASNNPEVVAPLDKLQGILMRSMGGGGGTNNINLQGLIQGNNLQVVAVKQGRTFSAITGRKTL